MSAILKFDFQKRKQLRFREVDYLNYIKRPNFACDNYSFTKTRGNKNSSGPIPPPESHVQREFSKTNISKERIKTSVEA